MLAIWISDFDWSWKRIRQKWKGMIESFIGPPVGLTLSKTRKVLVSS